MKVSDYNHQELEKKWQEEWESSNLYSPDIKIASKPFYNLMMFPYPSAEGLHVGNMYAFTGADVFGRFQRMQGKQVLEPIGLDGFGIHSENYALKVNKHPKDQADLSQKNFYRQLRSIGNSFDWNRTVETYDPGYYKWTQWLFIKLFKAGLAYRKKAEVNWCPKDLTVLSDEQVIDGYCERCGAKVERRELKQWFFKITDYADRLLENTKNLDWTEKVLTAQKNWIGKSQGTLIEFKLLDSTDKITVFTVYPETIFGVTYMVLAPEHTLVKEITIKEQQKEVNNYIQKVKSRSSIERTAVEKDKTGVFTGAYCVNPVNGKKVPVWIADYVHAEYGTGAVMGVPASDHRDFAFSQKYKLEIIRVIGKTKDDTTEISSEADVLEEGVLVNSENFNGLKTPQEANEKVKDYLEEKGFGKRENQYHLRDWLISRQRYWGPPIPMIFCDTCQKLGKGERTEMPGWYTVPETDLPVILLSVEDWKPMGTGLSPLANHPEFYNIKCPGCGADAKRETDVSDTFLDSAWYFLRYPSTDIEKDAFDSVRTRKWLPVDKYIGGAEHSVLHLLYARFVTMVLFDLKLIEFEEPFPSFFAHGLIIKDGAKMSKSKGNVVVPDAYITKYGADTLRSYLMFLGPYSDGGDFRDSGIEGMNRFIKRVWTLLTTKVADLSMSLEGLRMMHKTIKKVTQDTSTFHYNTAIASIMEWYNFLCTHDCIDRKEAEVFLKLLAPFAPFLTEELWHTMGNKDSIHVSIWPEFEERYLLSDEVVVIVQVNGKKRGEMKIQQSGLKNQENLEGQARAIAKSHLENKEIKRVVYVPGKIINFVI